MKIRYLFEKIFFVVTNTARSLIEYSMIILELLLGYNNWSSGALPQTPPGASPRTPDSFQILVWKMDFLRDPQGSVVEYTMIILELLLGYNNLILWGAAPDPAGG